MTTKVTVEANHGWPVKVIAVDPKTGNWLDHGVTIVAAGNKRDFYVHNTLDLIVHEVQPDEKTYEKTYEKAGE
jgi:hypothetical protein